MSTPKTLEEKLIRILQTLAVKNITRGHPTLIHEELAQIIQTFEDHNYVRLPGIDGGTLLTGAEWYERFETEIHAQGWIGLAPSIEEAARKAAGLND